MTRIQDVSREDLELRRTKILRRLDTTYEEMAARAASHSLVGDEWAAWEELREISYLLAEDA